MATQLSTLSCCKVSGLAVLVGFRHGCAETSFGKLPQAQDLKAPHKPRATATGAGARRVGATMSPLPGATSPITAASPAGAWAGR